MDQDEITRKSKFLSYLLRHHPETIGLELDGQGWAHIPELIAKAREQGRELTRSGINEIIERSEKKRFVISEDGEYIRAGYGHSIDVNLGLEPEEPPGELFHGTAERNVSSILNRGLESQNRQYVHLSADRESAREVGRRHGKPVMLRIAAKKMYDDGHPFYCSESEPGIWLVDEVPPRYITAE